MLLLVQNAGYTLLRKYSTMIENVSSKEILLIGEIIKLAISVWFVCIDNDQSSSQGQGIQKLVWLITNRYQTDQKLYIISHASLNFYVLRFIYTY